MTTTCQNCSGATADAYLCARCCDRLRDTLAELPWWLARLTETAVGQTRMGDNGGRKSARRDELHGDDHPIALLPEAKTLDQARIERQRRVFVKALAAGGCNARASELLAEIADHLGYWVRVLCESRGVDVPALIGGRDYGVPIVAWLHQHVAAIALSEDAGDIAADVFAYRREVERVVNRPVRWLPLGECPERIEGPNQEGRDYPTCRAKLRAREDRQRVTCAECGASHVVSWLQVSRLREAEGQLLTADELVRVNRDQPHDYRVPERTLRQWRQSGRLAPREYGDDGDPLYSWLDVRLLRPRKPQMATTGAAAHA